MEHTKIFPHLWYTKEAEEAARIGAAGSLPLGSVARPIPISGTVCLGASSHRRIRCGPNASELSSLPTALGASWTQRNVSPGWAGSSRPIALGAQLYAFGTGLAAAP